MAKTSAPIRRALVAKVRANATLNSAVRGVFNGFSPEERARDDNRPDIVYNQVPVPYEDAWGSRMIVAVFDWFVYSRNEVEAHNFDQILAETLDGASLTVEDMSVLICTRVADVPMPPDIDEEGKKVYQIGGTYEVWTDQPL